MRSRYPHLFFERTESTNSYKSTSSGGKSMFRSPPRDRNPHAEKLQNDLRQAEEEAKRRSRNAELDGITLEFCSDPGFELAFESLELRTSGILLNCVRHHDSQMMATVFVPAGKLEAFVKKIDAYANKLTDKGKPKNQRLVESIARIRLAVVESFWTDASSLYPLSESEMLWWEVWIRISDADVESLFQRFRQEAHGAGIRLLPDVLDFPERRVVLAYASSRQWASSMPLLNMLAELRRAKELPTDILDLSPHEQGEFARETAARVHRPPEGAPAVCLLDDGVCRELPLLEVALDPIDALTVDPDWPMFDPGGHGTKMAGIALYGTKLEELIGGDAEEHLRHRLESVRLLPPRGRNDPAHYGAITQEAVARAEEQNPHRNRVICMAARVSNFLVGSN